MNLKEKFKNNELTIGSWITIGHDAIAEIMVKSGFDWLTIDMEHSSITMTEAQRLIRIIDLAGCVPLVRVGFNDSYQIKRAMDAGAHGIIVPMVNSRSDAEKAVNAVKYPPYGNRGVGLARAQGYGDSFEDYKQWLEKHSVVIVQIEHIDAVNNLEEILGVEGVDGFLIGPYDLSGSLGVPGDFNHPDVINSLNQVKKVASKFNKISGYHVIPPTQNDLREKIEQGYKFIAYSLDTLFLIESLKNSSLK